MIFIVLGTQKFQLNRLLKLIDDYISENIINEPVFAQIGNSTYEPVNYQYVRFMSKEDFDETVNRSDLLITHSGVGSIITALKAGKKVIVYPRLKKYKEHVDDHQLDIARAFEKKNYLVCCYEDDELSDKIQLARESTFDEYVSEREKMVNLIEEYIESENLGKK